MRGMEGGGEMRERAPSETRLPAGSFSEILKISQIFGPTLTIYRYFIALIQFVCISVVRTYTILTSIYFPLLFD